MAVLSHSLLKHASQLLEITWMMLSRSRTSFWYSDPATRQGWNTLTWATPFSALRWGLPAFYNYSGRCIYMDSDMIAMADIAELWNQPIPDGKALLAKGGKQVISCVMLMDCQRMKGVVPPLHDLKGRVGAYREARGKIAHACADYAGNWNCRDGEHYQNIFDPDIKVLHYTSIPTQPNHRHARKRLKAEGKPHWYPGPDKPHPRPELTKLFDDLLDEAAAVGAGPEAFRVAQEFGEYGRK